MRDGRPDLVVGGNGHFDVLLATGSRLYPTATSYTAASYSYYIALGDFNRDGALDIASHNTGTLSIVVTLNNGSGGFAAAPANVGTGGNEVVSADVDRDGKIDLVTTGPMVRVLRGGTSDLGTTVPYFALADFNLDGKLDIVASFTGGLRVALGAGDGTFGAPLVIPTNAPAWVAVGDLDRDGLVDIVFSHTASSKVYVLLNTSR